MSWVPPQAREAPAEAPPKALDTLDHAGFAALLGPALSNLAGVAIRVRPADSDTNTGNDVAAGPLLTLATLTIPHSSGLDIALDERIADLFSERLFGTRRPPAMPASRPPAEKTAADKPTADKPADTPADAGAATEGQPAEAKADASEQDAQPEGPAASGQTDAPAAPPAAKLSPTVIRTLPPGTAGWQTVARLFATLLVTALRESGIEVLKRPVIPARGADAPAPLRATIVSFQVEIENTTGWLRLAAQPAESAPKETPEETLRRWRTRAAAGAKRVPVEISLRLPERRMALVKALALRPGDILPLERPHTLTLIVNGQPYAHFPADRFLPRMETSE